MINSLFQLLLQQVDQSVLIYKSILVPVFPLKSQFCHYESYLNYCIDSTWEMYGSSNVRDLPIVIQIKDSNSIIPNTSPFDFDRKIK